MCGICGIYRRNIGKIVQPSVLGTMCDTICRRGPDEQGFYLNGNVELGICRLSIIDLIEGQQPIWNEDKTCCIVYDGELYNFLDLRPELEAKGHTFCTHSDTEVILHAYEEWGPNCLSRFNGMFAIAIWDMREKSLFLARDRIGEKPALLLYIRVKAGSFSPQRLRRS